MRKLYHRLIADGFDPWLDEESLIAGQPWETMTLKALRRSDVVIVCLTHNAINKAGYIQKEIKFALDVADQQPEDAVFLIPLKFEECNIPERLSWAQGINYFDDRGHERLVKALWHRAEAMGLLAEGSTGDNGPFSLFPVHESLAPSTPADIQESPTTPAAYLSSPSSSKPKDRFKEFVEYVGRPCNVQSDLKWETIKAFLERIPTVLEQVDFLEELKKLPDDGIVDGTVKNPQLHQKNLREVGRPLQSECSRLLSLHFNIEAILNRARQIADHSEALTYLWNVKNDYRKYHPTIKRGSFFPEELSFWNDINTEIQYRKDLLDSLAKSSTIKKGIASSSPSETEARAYAGISSPRDNAEPLYQRVKDLFQNNQPLDRERAKLIIELADDAIKEFGNTNQEKKVELRQIKEKAREFLPFKTIQKLRERVQEQTLSWWPWQNKKLRIAIYVTVALIGITFSVLAIKRTLLSDAIDVKSTSVPLASPEPTTTPSPTATPTPTPSPSSSIRAPRKASSTRQSNPESPCSPRDRMLRKC